MKFIKSNKYLLYVFFILSITSCNQETEEGEVTITLKPTTSAVVKVPPSSSCQDLRDYKFQIANGSTDTTLGTSVSGHVFWFSSLKLTYSAYSKFNVISKAFYIDFNDSRIGGKKRCDITQEVESSFDSEVFKAAGYEAINGTNGVYQSTPSCKIICSQQFTVPENLKQTDFTVMGIFKVRFTVQKKNSDEAPVNIYSQETVTVNVNID